MTTSQTEFDEGPALLLRTAIPIEVTPLFKQGNEVVCDIDPPPGYAKGGHIQLSNSSAYTLTFKLLPPVSGPLAGLKFDTDAAGACQGFWSNAADCPTHAMNDQYYQNPRLDPSDPNKLLVDVDTPGNDYAVHYRLNFNNNGRFDPIIINN
jgi:hypothetical protein